MSTQDSSPDAGTAAHDKGPLLGRQVAGSESYDPSLLFPVPRANARSSLPAGSFNGFGQDIWHAYELSWLSGSGMPRMYLGRICVPATTENLIESKSLKLYLNSLNSHSFSGPEQAREVIERDLSAVADGPVTVSIVPVDDGDFTGLALRGDCLDSLSVAVPPAPDTGLLQPREGNAQVHTHLMRSLCPVTAQPDWATVVVETRGVAPEPKGLLAYLLAFRNHQEFHEQCVERIYSDLNVALSPEFLSVQALYTRRGGLDICPWRCSRDIPAPTGRLNRQ